MTTDNVVVKVLESTQVKQFLPFTALPARYKGCTVELVIVPDPPTEEAEEPDLFGLPVFPVL